MDRQCLCPVVYQIAGSGLSLSRGYSYKERMHNLAQRLLFIGLLSIGTGKAVQTEDLRGFVLASSCVSCHGDASPNGAGIPAIVGRDAAFIADALKSFRSGARESTIMQRRARGYDDADVERIAAWLARTQSTSARP